jgi:hypothetical protein
VNVFPSFGVKPKNLRRVSIVALACEGKIISSPYTQLFTPKGAEMPDRKHASCTIAEKISVSSSKV